MSKSSKQRYQERMRQRDMAIRERKKAGEPDWSGRCYNCGASPTVPASGLCGPCHFGEAETSGGNW